MTSFPNSETTATAEAPVAEAAEQAQQTPQPTGTPDKQGWYRGTGRRKSSSARVRIRPGEGTFVINGREIDAFFSQMQDRNDMHAPLEATGTRGNVDVYVQVQGGGATGQAGAVRLGLSRALASYDSGLENALRQHGFLTRDAREVERKKYGQPGARRKFQFSKR